MPAVPKSPPSSTSASSKRPGAPKAKGAVRAKSGCYTCRIRRKKCDEQANDQGHCSTCVRLRLECLGFGAKRPDWLRENRNVLQLRDKIKNFLASQGMIKGHSGSGPRSTEPPGILRLTITETEPSSYHSGSSSSPPSRSPPLAPEEYSYNHRHRISNTRQPVWPTDQPSYSHSGHYPTAANATAPDYRSESPASADYHHLSSPHSLVQSNQRHPTLHSQNQQLAVFNPALKSGISPIYNWIPTEAEYDLPASVIIAPCQMQDDYSHYYDTNGPLSDYVSNANAPISVPSHIDMSVPAAMYLLRYKQEVVAVQYLLGSHSIRNMIANSVSDHPTCKQAVTLLSEVHFLRFQRPSNQYVLDIPDVKIKLLEIERALNNSRNFLTTDDAMAALHLVSVVLFDGGKGGWKQYLETASWYVKNKMMEGPGMGLNALEKLRGFNEKEAFVIKTAIWFDVLASVTTRERPLLLEVVRNLFRPGQSGLAELSTAATSLEEGLYGATPNGPHHNYGPAFTFGMNVGRDEARTSMMSPMGCENRVVWALAEISVLSTWKRDQRKRQCLSIKDLVARAQEIEKELEVERGEQYRIKLMADFDNDPVSYSRYLAAHIFRASALLYLHAVVSDGYPHVAQIKLAVEEVMRWIRRIPWRPTTEPERKVAKSVIRSTVFGFYICGALTDDARHQRLLKEYLLDEAGEVVGNCSVIVQLLDSIWREREADREKRGEVLWREKLNNGDPILLV